MSTAKKTGKMAIPVAGDDKHSEMKIAPRQRRAKATIESILAATSDLLVQHGVENLSTNMICERAGLTPPALYRYFPNKYAILKELAVRLKKTQHEIFAQWIVSDGEKLFIAAKAANMAELEESFFNVQVTIFNATKHDQANIWISRILRTQPAMADLRVESRTRSLNLLSEHLKVHCFNAPPEEVSAGAIISMDLIHSTIELAMDENTIDPDIAFQCVAEMIAAQYARLIGTGK